MLNKVSKLAVIPARGGSKRLKDKNIYPLQGKPLIEYTIESVLESKCFDTVVVSTDSEKIANVAKKYDVVVHNRPAELATSRATVVEAMLDLMNETERHDIFAYFLPTCPLKTAEDIRGVMNLYNEDNVDAAISVVEYDIPIQLAIIMNGDNVVPVFDNLTSGLTNSRYIKKYYRPSGAVYSAKWESLIENKTFFAGNIKGHIMSKENSVDIDDLTDIIVAESILTKVKK